MRKGRGVGSSGPGCPYCGSQENAVVDGRAGKGFFRRRRECVACQRRYTTYENAVDVLPTVVKRGGHREPFDREKVHRSVLKALGKLDAAADAVAEDIVAGLADGDVVEMPSTEIAEVVVDRLWKLAPCAALRYHSAAHHFTHVRQFLGVGR